MTGPKESPLESAAWVPRSAVPPALARPLDPDRPLEASTQFIPSAGFSLLYAAFAGFWWLVAATLVVAVLAELGYRLLGRAATDKDTQAGLPVLLGVGLLLGAIWAIFKLTRSIQQRLALRRDWQAGRFRDGIFLLEEGLLLGKNDLAFFLPRDVIANVERVERGRGETPDVQVLYDDNGSPARLSLLHMDLEMQTFELLRTLNEWLETEDLT